MYLCSGPRTEEAAQRVEKERRSVDRTNPLESSRLTNTVQGEDFRSVSVLTPRKSGGVGRGWVSEMYPRGLGLFFHVSRLGVFYLFLVI